MQAMTYIKQALQIARQIGDAETTGHHLANLGVLYSEMNQPDKAIEYLQQARDKLKPLADDSRSIQKDITEIDNLLQSIPQTSTD